MNKYVDVTYFGAGKGRNDTAAIQSAINYSVDGGYTGIVFPSGGEYVLGVGRPWYLCRWWLKSRLIKGLVSGYDENGKHWHNLPMELYVPWWAKPLDALHQLIFGKIDMNPNRILHEDNCK